MLLVTATVLFCFANVLNSYKSARLENSFSPPNHFANEQRRSSGRHLSPQAGVSSKHFISPQYSFVPKYLKKRVEHSKALHPNKNLHQTFLPKVLDDKQRYNKNQRKTRKIPNFVKLDKSFLKTQAKPKKYDSKALKKDLIKHLKKDDNLAIESQAVQTVVKPPVAFKSYSKTTYSAKPSPKFIIKQAGPSQTYGWLGHGSYAPLNIPNIFKNIGLDTTWNPSINSVFPVGLSYPPSKNNKVTSGHHQHPVTTTSKTPTTTESHTEKFTYEAPKIKESPIPVYKPSNSVYKNPSTVKPLKGHHQSGKLETLWYDTEKVKPYTNVPIYKPSRKPQLYIPHYSTTTKTTTTSTTTKPIVYKTTTTQKPYIYTSPVYNPPSTTKASYRQPTTPVPQYSSPSYFQSSPSNYFSSPTYKPQGLSTSSPFFGSPSPYISTSAPYFNNPSTAYSISPAPQPSYASPSYKPFDFSQPIKPFTAFNFGAPAADPVAKKFDTEQSSPVVGIIETEAEQNSAEDDGEVFYIFYENENLNQGQQKVGQSLQRFIQEDPTEDDNVYSETNVEEVINIDEAQSHKFPNFAQIQEIEQPEQPLYYDVPIKIEETSPYDSIRTIYVPIENAINVPDGSLAGAVGVNDIETTVPLGFSQDVQDASNLANEAVRSHTIAVDGNNTPYFGTRLQPLEHHDLVI